MSYHCAILYFSFLNFQTLFIFYPETGAASGKHKENEKLRHIINRLEDENNMLKLKTEILLDMVCFVCVYYC